MSVVVCVGAQEQGEDEETKAPDVTPGTLQTLSPEEVTGRHHWSKLHKLLRRRIGRE